MVSEYEEREAAHAAGQTWPEYQASDREDRIATVAWHRTRRLVELHVDKALEDQRKAEARRASRRRRQ